MFSSPKILFVDKIFRQQIILFSFIFLLRHGLTIVFRHLQFRHLKIYVVTKYFVTNYFYFPLYLFLLTMG
jgi:hypothetical protein